MDKKADKKWKYDQAIEKYTKAIELNPANYSAFNNRGLACLKRGKYDCAFADFDRAIALNPLFIAVYINRGNAYQEIGRYDRAVADFDRAIELDPGNDMAYNNRGFVFLLQGRLAEAEADIAKALDLNPRNIYALNSMAELHAVRKDAEGACRWLKKAIESGYTNWTYLKTSKTYRNIIDEPCFRELLKKEKAGARPSGS